MAKQEQKRIKHKIGTKLKLVKALECSDFQEGDIVEVKSAGFMYNNFGLKKENGKGLFKEPDVYGYMYKGEIWETLK